MGPPAGARMPPTVTSKYAGAIMYGPARGDRDSHWHSVTLALRAP